MCRIIVASGNIDVAKILDSIILMAKDRNSLHELNRQNQGRWQHADGWGVAYLNQKGTFTIAKSPQAIFDDPTVKKLYDLKTSLLIAHVRRKAGSEISIENTHPFKAKHSQLGECVFCHNGMVEDEITFDPRFKTQGKTDSERLFYSILSDIKDNHPKNISNTIRNNLKTYTKTKGTNIVLSTKDKTFIAMRKNELPKYYGMVLAKGNDFIVISSEKLKMFPNISWKSVLPGEVVIIQNGTSQFSLSKEKTSFLQKLAAIIRN
ncbi:MAG: class II glutamine amidotransferase [Nanoarchaeota archaeon]|nr:class II glutamine amidotransferase [Nanoarchaeota archaeon]